MSETVNAAVKRLTADFLAAGIESARLDARVLTGHVLGVTANETFLKGDVELTAVQASALQSAALRRGGREPVSRILGHREFWGLDFTLNGDTLDPRPDTETLVSAALEMKSRWPRPRILDLGTGTGCILIALLKEWPEATGVGVDASVKAVACAAANAARLGFTDRGRFVVSDWARAIDERFDIVVSNPPYLTEAEMDTRQPEVMFDPSLALTGGRDGLDAYRAIVGDAPRVMNEGALLALEVGAAQAAHVAELLAACGFNSISIRRDLSGQKRCVLAHI